MSRSVLVAMSGGVDSSVAAHLLSQDMKVIGITMKLWCYGSQPGSERACCSEESVEDARAVARTLGIKHYVVSLEDEFEKNVILKFLGQYVKGRTPNPCVLCNSLVRFKSLLGKARSLGLDAIATGHYVRLSYDETSRRHQLFRAADKAKDQSYFLWGLKQDVLARSVFPLGELRKETVRAIAGKAGLPVAEKRESQDICFVGEGNYGEFLVESLRKNIRQAEPGPIFTSEGKRIGIHKGIVFYTIGQRRGLGIGGEKPLYVTGVDAKRNALSVGSERELCKTALLAGEFNPVSVPSIDPDVPVLAKIRYKHNPSAARIGEISGKRVRVEFDVPQRAITPGQSVVFYDGDMLLGGATIEAAL